MSWTYEVEAYNTATDSTNRIHSDEVAKQYGFRGGLVPGVDVWAYLTRPCVDRWGTDFLTSGRLDARFASPVYTGEVVTVVLDDTGAVGIEGRASGVASIEDHPPATTLPSAPLADPRPPASAEALAVGEVLGTLAFHYRAEHAASYLDDIRETSPVYEGGAIAHPGWLARQCNTVLARHVVLGPWIHVGTDARHRRIIRDGDALEVRAVVTAQHERKGHQFVELDVVITANDAVAYTAAHTAIWQPRTN